MTSDRGLTALYARGHRWHLVLAGLASIPLTEWWLGSLNLVLPGSHQPLVFRLLAPAVVAALFVGNRHTPMFDWEATAARSPGTVYGAFLAGSLLLGALVTFIAQLLLNDSETALIVLRAFIIFTGLALISARLFSWRTAWILPLGSYFPLTYLQTDSQGQSRWWDWSSQPASSLPCWTLAVLILVIGTLLLLLTPHLIGGLRKWFNRH